MSEPLIGWRVLDPDGNVVDSGPFPAVEMQMVSSFGEGVDDGGDRPGDGVEDAELDN